MLFSALDADVLQSVTVNGVLPAVDPATGRQATRYLVSVTTSRTRYDELVLDAPELDPVQCMRRLDAKLSPHPLDHEEIPPFLTFEVAKYRLGASVDVAAGLDGRADISTMEWGAFEQLVRQLFHEMTGVDTRVTRRSRDDGIDAPWTGVADQHRRHAVHHATTISGRHRGLEDRRAHKRKLLRHKHRSPRRITELLDP